MSMADLKQSLSLIENAAHADFHGPKSDDLIARAERTLGLTFPPSYRAFISLLGCGAIRGFEVYGLIDEDFEHSSIPDAIWLTLQERRSADLPKSVVLIADNGVGGWYAIDTSKKNADGDSPVIDWWPNKLPGEIVAEDFGAFLLENVNRQTQ